MVRDTELEGVVYQKVWLRQSRFAGSNIQLVGYTIGEWTLNELLTKSSSLKKCSKRRISGHSAQATSLPRIAAMTKCMRTVRGSASGRISVFAADPRIQCSD